MKWVSNENVFLIRRCKDYIRSHPPSVHMCRVTPISQMMFLWPETSPCTSGLMIGLDWYPYQWFRCRSGGARTWFLSLTQGTQITLERCMHLLISLYTIFIYIRRHRSQSPRCEDRKTGWCTKPHANFFANDNNVMRRFSLSVSTRGSNIDGPGRHLNLMAPKLARQVIWGPRSDSGWTSVTAAAGVGWPATAADGTQRDDSLRRLGPNLVWRLGLRLGPVPVGKSKIYN